jgi:CRP-like cAMP-binding protein
MLSAEACIAETLENPNSIYSTLNSTEKEELRRNLTIAHYRRNEYIFREGEKPAGFKMLLCGKVKILKEGIGGREQIIRMARIFGLIGFRALFAGEYHIASAVTLEESVITIVPADYIFHKAMKNSDFSLKLARMLASELGSSNLRTVSLTQKHVRGRLAESLLILKDCYGFENDGSTLKIALSREDIANFSNMTTSNAIRTLSNFANENIIAIDGRKIKILDFQKLDRICKLG